MSSQPSVFVRTLKLDVPTVKMRYINFLGLSALAGVSHALSLTVGSAGGNGTSGMQYGIMFEVIGTISS